MKIISTESRKMNKIVIEKSLYTMFARDRSTTFLFFSKWVKNIFPVPFPPIFFTANQQENENTGTPGLTP